MWNFSVLRTPSYIIRERHEVWFYFDYQIYYEDLAKEVSDAVNVMLEDSTRSA